MQVSNFVLKDYLTRIGQAEIPAQNLAGLASLMRHQLFSIPFENLDTQSGKVVSMDPDEIVHKLVYHKRGGYCFEVNGLFAMALTALEIPYRFVAARPLLYHDRRPKTHMAVIAELEGRQWLCDLGFGSYGIRSPIALDMTHQLVEQDDDAFQLQHDNGNYLLQAKVNGFWTNQFEFDLSPHEWIDFLPANFYSSKYPGSLFVQKLVVIQHTPQGRKILLDHHFKTIQHGNHNSRVVSPKDIPLLLQNEFNINCA